MTWDEHEDYISGFEHDADGTTLLASSADCSISVMDMRKAANPQTRSEAFRKSDDQEDEMLSIVLLKNGRKVMCGSQQGVLSVWSWGVWGDVSDRFPGHPSSIDALLKVDEDTVLTGASDGIIRLVQLHPDKLLGVLGEHDGYPVEKLQFNSDRTHVGSVSHDNFIRLWDARVLQDDNGNDDDDEEEEDQEDELADEEDQKMPAISTKETLKHESDDDWDDVDDSGSDCDGGSEDATSDSDEDETANDRRSKRLKSENEKFFDDL
jgi:WD40 repeat protein